MAYEKTNWVDNETPISAENLNKMEEGIVEASKTGGVLDGSIIEWEEEEIPEGYEEVESDIVNSTEVTDKTKQTYSAEVIDGLFTETKNNYLTRLYSASSFSTSGTLSESIDNFYGVLIVTQMNTYNGRGSVFLPVAYAKQRNISIPTYALGADTAIRGANVIIGSNGKSLEMLQTTDKYVYITAVYGVFRK